MRRDISKTTGFSTIELVRKRFKFFICGVLRSLSCESENSDLSNQRGKFNVI
jgi:hypothetical protein